MAQELICPICNKNIDYINAVYDLTRHIGTHDIIEIIKSYANYYLEQNDFPLSELNWGDD